MATFSLKLDTTEARRNLLRLKSKAGPAVARALKRAGDSAKTAMVREMARDLGLKVGTVRDQVKTEVVGDRANAEQLVARVSVSGKRIPLIEFGAKGPVPSRGRGRGVTARLNGGRQRYPNAFIATVGSGRHTGVFQRVPGSHRHGPAPNRSQLPIYELRGPSLPHVFRKYISVGMARGQETLVTNLEHEFKFAMQTALAAA